MLLRDACNEGKTGCADAARNGQVAFLVDLDLTYFGIVFQHIDSGRNDRTQLLLIGTGIDSSVKKGDYNTRMPAYKDVELNQLSTTFNRMTEEINYLIKEVYENHLLIKESEINFLQAQMNPIFCSIR